MASRASAFVWMLAGLGLAVVPLVALRVGATRAQFDLNDHESALSVAAISILKEFGGEAHATMYVALDDGDPSEAVRAQIQGAVLGLKIRPISERSAEADHCKPEGDRIPIGACEEDDFVRVQTLIAPLWHVMFVRTRTSACGTEMVLVKIRRWHIVSERGGCT
jgi:hypothetical protein